MSTDQDLDRPAIPAAPLPTPPPLLEMRGITKRFPGVVALQDVQLRLHRGQVRDAKRAGIALIHQELMLAPNLDVAGNIFLGNEDKSLGLITPLNRGDMNR